MSLGERGGNGYPGTRGLLRVLAKGEVWFRVPETLKFEILGKLPSRVMGKDVILKIAGDYGTDVALYKSAKFVGPAVEEMSLSDRWAIANMGVEIGAKFAIFEAGQKTFSFYPHPQEFECYSGSSF